MRKHDYLVVGCGLFGSVFAQCAAENGYRVLAIDKRGHIGGNGYTESVEGINIHKYGAHIFHTDNERVWRYINRFADFNNYVHRVKVKYKGLIFSFPINLMTLYQLWGVTTPGQAREKLELVRVTKDSPENLEDWVLSQVGGEIYGIFIKGYTIKQWGKDPAELPTSIIERIPIRLTFDDNYYNDPWQGIPVGGYTQIFEKLLEGVDVQTGVDYFKARDRFDSIAERIIYTGKIDEFFGYKYGRLEYRSLRFEDEKLKGDFQGNAVINYTDEQVPFTRIIEHKHFELQNSNVTIITREYPADYANDSEPYYPLGNERNTRLYLRYKDEAHKHGNIFFGGRLAEYEYYDMDDVIGGALSLWKSLENK
jgi:UDP-galactopyranose mutase